MNLHEYQAKDLLRKYNLPILEGKSYIENVDDLKKDLQNIKGPPWVIKSQIHAGGRGAGKFLKPFNTKGGVQITESIDDAHKIGIKAITLTGRGEPTLHPKIGEMLDYCSGKFFELKMNTNATKLNEKLIHQILKSDITDLVFSVDSYQKSKYEFITARDCKTC